MTDVKAVTKLHSISMLYRHPLCTFETVGHYCDSLDINEELSEIEFH